MIQLETIYHLNNFTIDIADRCIPLYPHKDIQLAPRSQVFLQLTGLLPSTFSSGYAIVHILPIPTHLSILTVETEFVNQITCFQINNNSCNPHFFPKEKPFAYLDTRSLGYYDPPSAMQTISTSQFTFPSPCVLNLM